MHPPGRSIYPQLNDRAWLRRRYVDQQRLIGEIAAEVGAYHSTVTAALRRAGIERRRGRAMPAELEDPVWLAERYADASGAVIAAELGVSEQAVYDAMERAGIERRRRAGGRRRGPSRLDDADWLARRYEEASGNAIAAELGVSAGAVYRALDRHGIDKRQPVAPRPPLRRPHQLDDADWLTGAYATSSARAIAAELGVTPHRVLRALDRHGIERRPPGRHPS